VFDQVLEFLTIVAMVLTPFLGRDGREVISRLVSFMKSLLDKRKENKENQPNLGTGKKKNED